eukprot:128678-Hanusia_phi.AAC.2
MKRTMMAARTVKTEAAHDPISWQTNERFLIVLRVEGLSDRRRVANETYPGLFLITVLGWMVNPSVSVLPPPPSSLSLSLLPTAPTGFGEDPSSCLWRPGAESSPPRDFVVPCCRCGSASTTLFYRASQNIAEEGRTEEALTTLARPLRLISLSSRTPPSLQPSSRAHTEQFHPS